MSRLFLLALLLTPTLASAQAQDKDNVGAIKFNPKQIEKDFAPLPVYADAKGKFVPAVENEVMFTKDDTKDMIQATWVVTAKAEKVVEFYEKKLNTKAVKKGDFTLGTAKWTIEPRLKKGDARVYKVTLTPTDGGGGVQIILTNRAIDQENDTLPD